MFASRTARMAFWTPTALALTLSAAGCGPGRATGSATGGATGGATGATSAAEPPIASPVAEAETVLPTLDPAKIAHGIDNPYLPLAPGTRWNYVSVGEATPEHDDLEVLAETRKVMGIPCVVVRDTVTVGGVIKEATDDWYVQDQAGNVWYMGESVQNYKNGQLVDTHGAWEAGIGGAKPGIVMWADPQPGAPYRQEYLKGEAEDMAKVVGLDSQATVPFGTFDHLIVTKEWSPLETDVVERKSYAKGIGMVLEETIKGSGAPLHLVNFTKP